jgi:hypothetical protein
MRTNSRLDREEMEEGDAYVDESYDSETVGNMNYESASDLSYTTPSAREKPGLRI